MKTLSSDDMDKLRHMLGARSDQKKRNWGYRNHFAPGSSLDVQSMERLELAGLVKEGAPYHDTFYYHATEKGCAALGFSLAQTKRAMGEPK